MSARIYKNSQALEQRILRLVLPFLYSLMTYYVDIFYTRYYFKCFALKWRATFESSHP